MGKRWHRWKNPWDREYAMRGSLWRGGASIDPLPQVLAPPGPVVEVGCGDGKFTVALAAYGYRPVGIDFSRNALKVARPTVRGRWVQGDAFRLPLRDGSVPGVVARYVLGAMSSAQRSIAAQEMVRVLRPAGVLLVEDFSREDFRFGQGKEVEALTFERNHGILSHYFVRGELQALFPDLNVLRSEELRHTQRIEGVSQPRASFRLVFSKPSSVKGA